MVSRWWFALLACCASVSGSLCARCWVRVNGFALVVARLWCYVSASAYKSATKLRIFLDVYNPLCNSAANAGCRHTRNDSRAAVFARVSTISVSVSPPFPQQPYSAAVFLYPVIASPPRACQARFYDTNTRDIRRIHERYTKNNAVFAMPFGLPWRKAPLCAAARATVSHLRKIM